MKEMVNVKFVKRYDFADVKTGERIYGVKVEYEGDNVVADKDYEGIQRVSLTTRDMRMYEKFKGHVPGRYELDLQVVPVGNKTRLELVNATYIEPAKIIKAS